MTLYILYKVKNYHYHWMKTKLIVLQNINKTLKMYYIPRFECENFQVKFKDVIKDSLISLVNEVNLEANSNGLSRQAMDNAHASLVSLNMKEEGFEEYRCDKNTTLGLNLLDFGKVLKLAKPNDVMTILANEVNSFLTIKNIIKVSNI